MSDETTQVGGIEAPVRANITDFMTKFDQIDKQAKVVSENIVSSLEKIAAAMKDVNGQNFDNSKLSAHKKEVDETTEKYKSLQRQVKEAATAMDKAWQSGTGFEIAKRNFNEVLNRLVAFKKEAGTLSIGQEKGIFTNLLRGTDESSASFKILTDRIKELNIEQQRLKELTNISAPNVSDVSPAREKALQEEQKIRRAIEQQQLEAYNKYLAAESKIQAVMNENERITELNQTRAYESHVATNNKKFQQEQAGIEKLNQQYAAMYRNVGNYIESNTKMSALQFTKLKNDLASIEVQMASKNVSPVVQNPLVGFDNVKQYNSYIKSLGGNFQILDGIVSKMGSHLQWMAGATALSALLAIPYGTITTIKEVEQGMAGVNQVLDHNKMSQEAAALGINDHVYAQQKLREETNILLGITAQYGEKINDVIEATKLWGRAYKDVAVVNALVHQSMILAVADNFSLTDANKGLEAAMFQYGLVAKDTTEAIAYSSKIVDIWTKVAHNAQVSAQDLAHGTEQAGSVAHMTGVDFEFLTAMIATGVRATGKSGNEIGTMIKSVLGSFQSDKAQKELAKLGISIKEVGDDGQEHFKKAQDVLLDLALTAQATDKDVSKMFQAVSGGKWQWSKAAAMLGDYQEFIKTWGMAVTSTGFSAGQVDMQLDTLSRKMEKLKADMQGLAVNVGNNGLTQWLKEQVSGIDELVLGIGKLSSAQVKAIEYVGVAATAIYLLSNAFRTYTIAAEEAAVATTLLGKASIFASKFNIVAAVLTAVSFAIGSYVEKLGEAEAAERQAAQQQEDKIAVANQQLDMYKQQSDFVETLISSYKKMQAEVDSGTLTDDKAITVKKNMQATLEELTKVTGDDGIAQMVAAGQYDEASQIERDAYKTKSDEIRGQIKDLRDKQVEYTKSMIQEAQDRIDALQSETSAWGIWAQAQQIALNQYAGILDKQIAFKKKIYNNMPDILNAEKTKLGESLQSDIETRESLRGQRPDSVNQEIESEKRKLASLLIQLDKLKISSGMVNYDASRTGGDIVVPSDKRTGTGTKNPPLDRSANMESKVDKFELDSTIDKAAAAADRYKSILAVIDDMQNRMGASYGLLDERIKAMNSHMADLQDTITNLKNQAQDDINKINDLATSTGATVTISGNANTSNAEGSTWNRETSNVDIEGLKSNALDAISAVSQKFYELTGQQMIVSSGMRSWGGHVNGQKFDVVDSASSQLLENDENGIREAIINYAHSLGVEVIDEYSHPSANATAGHLDFDASNFSGYGSHEVTIEGLGSVLASHGISQEQWQGYSKDQKLAFAREYKEEINNGNVLIQYLQRLSETDKKIAEYQKQYDEEKKKIYETALKGLNDIQEYQDKLSDLKKRTDIASLGIFATDEQKDRVALQQLIENKRHIDDWLKNAVSQGIDTNSLDYKTKQVQSTEMGNQIEAMQKVTLPNDEYKYKTDIIELDKQIQEVQLGNYYTAEQKDAIELTAATKKLAAAKEKLATIDPIKDPKGYKEQLVVVDNLTNQIEKLKDKTLTIREGMADMFTGMMRSTDGFKDFWKNAWYDMAEEAIRNIWRVNQAGQKTSFLGSIFGGLFGGGSVANTGQFTSGGQVLQGPVMEDGSFFRANGGPVEAGKAYVVGEKRPELFVPDTNGRIIPDLSMVQGGNTTNSQTISIGGFSPVIHAAPGTDVNTILFATRKQFNNEFVPKLVDVVRNNTAARTAIRGAAK